jgi:hypothetical protein
MAFSDRPVAESGHPNRSNRSVMIMDRNVITTSGSRPYTGEAVAFDCALGVLHE